MLAFWGPAFAQIDAACYENPSNSTVNGSLITFSQSSLRHILQLNADGSYFGGIEAYDRAISDALDFYDQGYLPPNQMMDFDLSDEECAFRRSGIHDGDTFAPRIASPSDLRDLDCLNLKKTLATALVDTIETCGRDWAVTINRWFDGAEGSMFGLVHAEHLGDASVAGLTENLWESANEPNLEALILAQREALDGLGVSSSISTGGIVDGMVFAPDYKSGLLAKAVGLVTSQYAGEPETMAKSLSFIDLNERKAIASLRSPSGSPIRLGEQVGNSVLLWDEAVSEDGYVQALKAAEVTQPISMAEMAVGIATGSVTEGQFWVYSTGIDVKRFLDENGIDVNELPGQLGRNIIEKLDFE